MNQKECRLKRLEYVQYCLPSPSHTKKMYVLCRFTLWLNVNQSLYTLGGLRHVDKIVKMWKLHLLEDDKKNLRQI